MRIKLSVLIVTVFIFSFFINCSGGGDATPTTPANLQKALVKAVETNDKEKAKILYTKEYWDNKRDAGKHFFKQAARKKFQIKEKEIKTNGEKSVVISDIVRKGKVVDQVFFYCIKKNDLWFFDGMDENRNHIPLYLEGKLPGSFHPADYPSDKQLETLGAKLIEIASPLKEATDPPQQETLLKGIFTGKTAEVYSKLRLLRAIGQLQIKVTATHWVTSINRGAIVIKDETGKEKAFIYVAKDTEGWKLIGCSTGWLSAESLLR